MVTCGGADADLAAPEVWPRALTGVGGGGLRLLATNCGLRLVCVKLLEVELDVLVDELEQEVQGHQQGLSAEDLSVVVGCLLGLLEVELNWWWRCLPCKALKNITTSLNEKEIIRHGCQLKNGASMTAKETKYVTD